MARLLRMPEVAANAAEAVLQEWSVTENSPFSPNDTIATVETDKAAVDVDAEEAGVILKTLVPAGAQVEVGAPIAVLGDPGEQVADLDALLSQLGVAADASVTTAVSRDVPDAGRGSDAPARREPVSVLPGSGTGNGHADGARIFASPLARRLARESGLSVAEIDGTGPGGRIVRRDVEATIADRMAPIGTATTTAPDATPDAAAALEAAPDADTRKPAISAYTEIPHSRMRKAIASRLTESKQTTPHFYLRASVSVDKLLKLRERLNEMGTTKVSVNDLVIKAAARAHMLVPEMNVIWTPEAIRSFSSVDISVAVATDNGLVTPVLRAVDGMPISSVAAGVQDIVERARSGRLRQEELEGGAFSVTNLGMFGTEEFAAIVNPPQSAILAVGAAKREPIVKKDKLSIGTVMRVTLSVDHRAVDGAIAAQWMAAFVSVIEKPVQILA
jgi:pyruvate dehydrogenase E2 component (dihydrolipoamide acetyltransferase)